MNDRLLSSNEVAKAYGVSLRQLQWWDEQGIVSVNQSWHSREYTDQDCLKIQILVSLRKKGVGLKQIRMILSDLVKRGKGRFLMVELRGSSKRPASALCQTRDAAFDAGARCKHPVVLITLPEDKKQ